jgi:hypothetical protein
VRRDQPAHENEWKRRERGEHREAMEGGDVRRSGHLESGDLAIG